MVEPTNFRSRHVALNEEDIRRLSALLQEAFPEARYYMEPTPGQINDSYPRFRGPKRTRPPRLLIHPSLHRIWLAGRRWNSDICMVLDPEWQPRWYMYTANPSNPHLAFWPPHHPSVDFRSLRGLKRAFRTEMIASGFIDVRCNPAMPEHFRFASKILRLVARVASNRNLEAVNMYTGTKERYIDKGAWTWIGHDTRRWALEDPARIAALSMDWGYRPLPDHPVRDPFLRKVKKVRR